LVIAYLRSLAGGVTWQIDLYVNDYTPQPGDVYGAYVPPNWGQWPGYFGVQFLVENWSEPQVVNHVAQIVLQQNVSWQFPPGNPPLTVYGYFVSYPTGILLWAERWAEPLTVQQPDRVTITPVFNLGIFPPPHLLNKQRGRKRRPGPPPFPPGLQRGD
jgi:hypothetical protein